MDNYFIKKKKQKEDKISTDEIFRLKQQQILQTKQEFEDVQKQIADIEQKIRDDDVKYSSEIQALTYQRDTNRKEYNENLSKILANTNDEINKLKEKHRKEEEYVHNELMTALQDTEEFISKSIGAGDPNNKQYRLTHAKKLSEKYASIVESMDTAISRLVTQRNQQIVSMAGQIEQTNKQKRYQKIESHDTNKKFKQEILKLEKMHQERMNQISMKYQSEREKFEEDIAKQISEYQTTEEMFKSIAKHNREKMEEMKKEIARLRVVIAKSSAVPKYEEDESKSKMLFAEVSEMESEINNLRARNSELRSLISQQDSLTKYSSTFSD